MHRHCVSGCGRFKSDGEEYDLLCRVILCDLDGVERRINYADIAAVRLDHKEIFFRPGNSKHVTERTKNDVLSRGDHDSLVDQLERRNAYWTARAVNELDLFGQQFVNAKLNDRVGLSTANLHQ